MIKKLLLLATIPFIGITTASAQCTPDGSITEPGIYPDTLPEAYVGTAYGEVVQFYVPTDTTFEYNGTVIPANVESVEIMSVDWSGLDAKGFSYACNPGTCDFPGGSNGCILISGTAPTSDMVGNYPLVLELKYHLTLPTFGNLPFDTTQLITDFFIDVNEPAAIGKLRDSIAFQVLQNVPNPFNGSTKIQFSSPTANLLFTFGVLSMLGEPLYTKEIIAHKGVNTFDFDGSGLSNGTYLYSLSNENGRVVNKMTISK